MRPDGAGGFAMSPESQHAAAKTRVLMRGFAAMNSIFDDHRFPGDELETMSMGVIEVVEQAGMA